MDQLLPNLQIIQFPSDEEFDYHELDCLSTRKPLRGVINADPKSFMKFYKNFQNIEILATPNRILNFECLRNLKQVYSSYGTFECFEMLAQYSPQVQRIYNSEFECYYPVTAFSNFSNLIIFPYLKILQMNCAYHCDQEFPGIYLIDFCPKLESAHFFIWNDSIVINEDKLHNNLKDLVIENRNLHEYDYNVNLRFSSIQRILVKCPNIEHLAIRFNDLLKDEHVMEIVKMMKHLEILDCHGCPKLTTQLITKINNYSHQHNRQINYLGTNSPLSDCQKVIAEEMNFMKHCFYTKFNSQPLTFAT
ncbi:uncharacterized protein LOC128397345 isoform X2 [Panonychus citri]|nr:uncharacterized protein LOC128397345 isoform X2 [Panonychus citri]